MQRVKSFPEQEALNEASPVGGVCDGYIPSRGGGQRRRGREAEQSGCGCGDERGKTFSIRFGRDILGAGSDAEVGFLLQQNRVLADG
jgi:hypothetical protein